MLIISSELVLFIFFNNVDTSDNNNNFQNRSISLCNKQNNSKPQFTQESINIIKINNKIYP